MKIKELRLVDIVVNKDGNTIYEGSAENATNNLLECDCQSLEIINNKVVIDIK